MASKKQFLIPVFRYYFPGIIVKSCVFRLSELNYTLKDVKIDKQELSPGIFDLEDSEKECYYMCKSYFDLKEYDRCAYFTEKCQSPCARFLHYYSR